MAESVVEGDGEENDTRMDVMTKEKSYMFEERLEMAGRLRQLGNERFRRGHLEDAAKAYQRALYHVDFDELQINFDFNDKHRQSLAAAKLPILLNLCQCLARSAGGAGRGENAARAAEYAGQAIELDRTCAKAWFWRGKAKMDTGDLEGGAADLAEAAKLAPGDKSVRLALKSLSMKQKELAAARKKIWGGMFRGRTTPTAPGRRQVEDAAARARGELSSGGGGDRKKGSGGDGGWGVILLAAVVGVVAFAVAGIAAAKFTQGRPIL